MGTIGERSVRCRQWHREPPAIGSHPAMAPGNRTGHWVNTAQTAATLQNHTPDPDTVTCTSPKKQSFQLCPQEPSSGRERCNRIPWRQKSTLDLQKQQRENTSRSARAVAAPAGASGPELHWPPRTQARPLVEPRVAGRGPAPGGDGQGEVSPGLPSKERWERDRPSAQWCLTFSFLP